MERAATPGSCGTWGDAVRIGGLIAVTYFLAARLGLALLSEPEGVAVYWPASGIAVGLLIVFGRDARWPLAIGVVVGTVAANVMSDRTLLAAMFKGVCNASEAILIAWLIERRFGQAFNLDAVSRVLGFLAAAILGTATVAVGGAITMWFLHTPAPLFGIWHAWFLSDGLGAVTVAPLLIGIGQLRRARLPAGELLEGIAALAMLGAMSAYVFTKPPGSWIDLGPVALLFPLLLWVAARCRPMFAAAAVFIVAIASVCATAFGLGRFGDADLPLTDRVIAAQAGMLVAALCALVLAALFAERRESELTLKESNERLRLALGGARLGAFSVDLESGCLECDARAAHIHGHSAMPKTLGEGRRFVHPDDLLRVDAAFAQAQGAEGVWSAEYRVVHQPGHPQASAVRWVAIEGSIMRNAEGLAVRMLGVTRDVTDQRLAKERLREQTESERRVLARISAGVPLAEVLDELVRAAEAGSDGGMIASVLFLDREGKRLLHGSAPGLPKAYNDLVHGIEIGPCVASCGTAAFRGEPVFVSDINVDPLWADYRHIAMEHGLRACWSTPIKAVDGRVLGTFAIYYREPRGPTQRDIDSIALITHTVALAIERHLSELALREGQERLQLALDGAELGVWSVDIASGRLESDARDIGNQGHDPNAPPKTLKEARSFVHPDDLPSLDAAFAAALGEARSTCKAEYRVRVPGPMHTARERWVAVQGTVVRNTEGAPVRLLGITRDTTERKLLEQTLRGKEEAFRRLLGALPAAVYTTDAAGRITYCNEAAIDLWRYKPALGKDKWRDVCRYYRPDGTPMPQIDCPTEIALKEGRVVRGREAILERADGTRVPILPCPTPLLDEVGTVVGVVNMTIDTTERKRAELALSERNAQLELAGRAALVGSYAFDMSSGMMQVSLGYAAIYDLPEGSTEITRDEWRARVHPEDLTELDADRRRCFAERQREHLSEYRILRSGSEIRWIESRSLVSYDVDWRPLRMVGVNIDVTERRRAEDHKNVLVAELDHRVKNALTCVAVIAQQTREHSRSMDEFLEVLDGRIHSLANTHALLSRGRWQGVSCKSLD